MNDLLWIAISVGGTATLVLGWLVYLWLFEAGALYHVQDPVHQLDEGAQAGLLSTVLTTPMQDVSSYALLNDGITLYEALHDAIVGAERTIHLEAYIFRRGRAADAILDALRARAAAGVRVRVIVDAIGSMQTPRSYFAPLIEAGGLVHRYHPLHPVHVRRWNNRTHRNLFMIDGTVGFIGGAGIGDQWIRADPEPWRDCALRVTGPIVSGLQAVFAENWLECSGELLVAGDLYSALAPSDASGVAGLVIGSTATSGRSTRARMLVQIMLAFARERIDLCSPYFVPDRGIRSELLAARSRGVAVRVISGGPYGDHGMVRRAGRRRYGPLLEAGVEIHEYASRMMHAKVLVIDGRWALLGSTNIDHRSFGINDEVNIVLPHAPLAEALEAAFEHDLAHSDKLELADWHKRAWSERILATLGRVLERHQ